VPKVAVIISITTQPGHRGDLWRLWDSHLRARVQDSAAQEAYLVVEDAADSDVLHLVEIYNDPAEMQVNAAATWFAAYMREAGPLLAGTPLMRTGTPVWSKGLPE
jgi:quinol monooxygenase YgiN